MSEDGAPPDSAGAPGVTGIKAARAQPRKSLAMRPMAPKPPTPPTSSTAWSSSTSNSSTATVKPAAPAVGHHGHHHGNHARTERPVGRRACGGAAAVQLDLAVMLPGERDEQGRFAQLIKACGDVAAVARVHLRTDGGALEACVHHKDDADVGAVIAAVRLRGRSVEARFKHKAWLVRGLESAQLAASLEELLQGTRGVLQASVGYAAERVVIEYDADVLDDATLQQAVRGLGCDLEATEAGHVCSHHAHAGGLQSRLEVPFVSLAALLIAGGLVADHVADQPLIGTGCYIVALLFGGFFPTRSAVLSLFSGKVDLETLMVLAAVGAAALGAWFEGAFLLFLFSLGHMLEHHAMDRARRAVETLEKLRPDTARVVRPDNNGADPSGEHIVELPLDQVLRGDVVMVRPGDRLPLDGVVVDGTSSVDQSMLTGESMPQPKQPGAEVWGGTVNLDGSLRVEVKKTVGESALSRLVDLVVEAESKKAKSQRFAQRVEKIFVPLVLIGAPLLVVVLSLMGLPVRDAVLRGLSLLVAASPCALAVSTPAAVLSAVARAARSGVLIKGGAHLESLAAVHTIALDKTGTLTEGKPRVTDVVVVKDGVTAPSDADAIVAVAAAAETLSAHPLAIAVIAKAREQGLTLGAARDGTAIHGKGLEAFVDDKAVRVGNRALFGAGLSQRASDAVNDLEGRGRTSMIVEHDGVVVGVIGVMDTPRAAAKRMVAALKRVGVKRTVMLSGDANAVARAVANEVGVDDVRAPLLPGDKVDAVKQLAVDGPVGMVGDGVNDAPALAAAAVGVAMGGAGSDVALETADVVLMGDDLSQLPFAIELARAATSAVRQNLMIALGVAGVLIVASIAGWVQVSHAVVLHEGSTVVVVLNGIRLLLFSPSKSAAL